MSTRIKNIGELKSLLNEKMSYALELTANDLVEQLKQHINTYYYQDYTPTEYTRTYQFLNEAPTMQKVDLLNIFIGLDGTNINYKEARPEDVFYWASQGFHGKEIKGDNEYHVWEIYVQWCHENIKVLLNDNFKKIGLNIRK